MYTTTGRASMAARVSRYLADLWERREFAWYLAIGSMRARNASTALGLVWWVLDPLFLGLIYFLVFGIVLRTSDRGGMEFIGYLLSGMFPFYYTRAAVQGGANSVIQNTRLLANLKFPRLILPVSALVQGLVGFGASLLVFFVTISPAIGGLSSTTLTLPLIVALHTAFNLGLGSLAARLAVPFRDLNNVLPYLLRIWLYLSPIIWRLDQIDRLSPLMATLLRTNPMFSLLSLYRWALTGAPLHPGSLATSIGWTAAIGVLGVATFVRNESKMVRYL